MNQESKSIIPFLTFADNAEVAINFYVSIFDNSKILDMTKYGKDERLEEGKIMAATFQIKGNPIMAMDIGNEYAQDFSWAISLFVSCDDESEFDFLFSKLSENGKVMMGPESVLNLRKVAWVTDKFGVTWQLIWE